MPMRKKETETQDGLVSADDGMPSGVCEREDERKRESEKGYVGRRKGEMHRSGRDNVRVSEQ